MMSFYIVIILVLIIFLISIVYCFKHIDVEEFNIKDKRIDKDIKIVFLSDLHNRNIALKISNIINEIKPDIIICGGDMINESLNKTNHFFELIEYIKDYKVFYTYGNHEEVLSEDDYKDYTNIVSNKPIILLNNRSAVITSNIHLHGLDNDIETYKKFGKLMLNKEYIDHRLSQIDKNKYNILVAHNPLEFKSYVDSEYDLVLSGHVHGGVIGIPFVGGLLSPDYTLFPKYYDGMYSKNGTKMIVSRGLGFSERIPFRLFCSPHVVVINLKRQ